MVLHLGSYGPDVQVNTAGSDTFNGGSAYDVASFYDLNYRAGTFGRDDAGNITFTHGADVETFIGINQIDFIDGSLIIDETTPEAEVLRLYQAALDRAPDQEGLNFWTEHRYAGDSLIDLAKSFLGSDEYVERFGTESTPTAVFVTSLYQNIFDRAPDTGGLDYWVDQIDSGSRDRPTVLSYFSQSLENVSVAQETADGIWNRSENAAEVARLYDSAYGRAPDLGGLVNFTYQLDSGATTLKDVAGAFVTSAEFTTLYGAAPTNQAYVAELYQNTLDRAGETDGTAFWIAQLDSGAMTKVDVLLAFSESAEHVALTASAIGGETPDQFGIAIA